MVKVSEEMAELMFDEFCTRWRIGRKIKSAKAEDREEFEEKKKIIKELMLEGTLIYNEDKDSLTYNFYYPELARNKTEIEIKRPRGGILAEGDKYGEKEQGKKLQAFLSHMTGMENSFFSGIDYVDMENITGVMNLFLLS